MFHTNHPKRPKSHPWKRSAALRMAKAKSIEVRKAAKKAKETP